MDLFSFLIFWISIVIFIIPFLFFNRYQNYFKRKILLEISKYKNIQNFININKERLEIANKIITISFTLSITSFFAMKIFDFQSLLFSTLFVIIFVFLFGAVICVNSLYLNILTLLYNEKDKQEKNN
jgi:putative effector of murein hydrolase